MRRWGRSGDSSVASCIPARLRSQIWLISKRNRWLKVDPCGLTKLTSTIQTSFMLQRDQRRLWFQFVSKERPIEARHTNKEERREEEAKGWDSALKTDTGPVVTGDKTLAATARKSLMLMELGFGGDFMGETGDYISRSLNESAQHRKRWWTERLTELHHKFSPLTVILSTGKKNLFNWVI